MQFKKAPVDFIVPLHGNTTKPLGKKPAQFHSRTCVVDEFLRDLNRTRCVFHGTYQQGSQFFANLSIHIIKMSDEEYKVFYLWMWIPPFEFGLHGCSHLRVYIPAQHQMCNDVIAGEAYTAVLLESCDLSSRRASSPKPYPGCCGGDRTLDIISAFLLPGHAGSFLFVLTPQCRKCPVQKSEAPK